MKIVIGHLFYDLLNLYGEHGNVLALEKALKSQGVDVEVRNLSIDDTNWDLENLDVIYIGAGTEQNQLLALNTLLKHKNALEEALNNNTLILSTGNSLELFGSYIEIEDRKINALNLFNFYTVRTDKRNVSECVFNYDEISNKILGFENHQGNIFNISNPLFTVEKGFSSNANTKAEGIKINNFYGTYLIGPLLVRNPEFLEHLCNKLIFSKDAKFNFKPYNLDFEYNAHKEFIKKYDKA